MKKTIVLILAFIFRFFLLPFILTMIFDIHTIENNGVFGTTYKLVFNNETVFIVVTIIIDILISFGVVYFGNYDSEIKTLNPGTIFLRYIGF